MRILYIADIHGANLIFKKSLSALERYEVDLLILAGDLTAKDIRPIIKQKDNKFRVDFRNKDELIEGNQLSNVIEKLDSYGHYYFLIDEAEFSDIAKDEKKVLSIIDEKSKEKIAEWCEIIKKKINLQKHFILITPGNDDIFEIDNVLKSYESNGIYSNFNDPLKINSIEIITVDYSNPTPWETPRELPEEKLFDLISERIEKATNPGKTIFNFHCPPFNTRIDLAPELDKNLKRKLSVGSESKIHVGSKAVRKSIELYQPTIGLHGHIHESPGKDKIGNTICINPGSEYWNGILYGYIIDLDKDGKIKNYYRIEG